jgi:hypothetical protein
VGYLAWRDRVLMPVTTIQLFLLQILHGNTAYSHPPHLSSWRFSAAVYCQARAKLTLCLFVLLVADLAELYHQRWRVETLLAQFKTSMQVDVLHGKTEPGVLKELTVCAIVYNLVHMVMCQAATLQDIRVERISFLGALRWLGAPTTGILSSIDLGKLDRP